MWTSLTGSPESIEAGSESESIEGDRDVPSEKCPFCEDVEAELEHVSIFRLIWWEIEFSLDLGLPCFGPFIFPLLSSLGFETSKSWLSFTWSNSKFSFCTGEVFMLNGPWEYPWSTDAFPSSTLSAPFVAKHISSSESMSSKSFIKLSASCSSDVEHTLGESENRRGEPMVHCSNKARSSSVKGKSNGVPCSVLPSTQMDGSGWLKWSNSPPLSSIPSSSLIFRNSNSLSDGVIWLLFPSNLNSSSFVSSLSRFPAFLICSSLSMVAWCELCSSLLTKRLKISCKWNYENGYINDVINSNSFD